MRDISIILEFIDRRSFIVEFLVLLLDEGIKKFRLFFVETK